jgi:hypothetical protein
MEAGSHTPLYAGYAIGLQVGKRGEVHAPSGRSEAFDETRIHPPDVPFSYEKYEPPVGGHSGAKGIVERVHFPIEADGWKPGTV